MNAKLKKIIVDSLCLLKTDAFFRYLNRDKMLIVNYHGVYDELEDNVHLFTHLQVDTFEKHLAFLKSNYTILSLSEFLDSLVVKKKFPDNAALISFDDGFMNNYEVAFPLLKKMNIPATIFLTTNYIDTENLLWFDELYLSLRQLIKSGLPLESILTKYRIAEKYDDIYSLYEVFWN